MSILILSWICDVVALFVVFMTLSYYTNKIGHYFYDDIPTIKIKYHATGIKLSNISAGNWQDLKSCEDVTLKTGEYRLISLGVSMKLPDGYEAHIVPRSSTFKNWGILQTNGMGVIDNSYSGNSDIWRFPAYATRDTTINKGDRICQFRVTKIGKMKFKKVYDLGDNNRGGFGSTGK